MSSLHLVALTSDSSESFMPLSFYHQRKSSGCSP
jgi:hypothetical protein